jgi:serine/threonine protein kinase
MIQSERWHQIEQICEGALKRPVSEREAFLKEACRGDEALRQEVDRLLAHEQTAKGFLEAPVLEAAAKVLVERQGESRVGQQLGAYKILSLLGAGGMGEVYLARDTLLDRKVAIKFLPPESTAASKTTTHPRSESCGKAGSFEYLLHL